MPNEAKNDELIDTQHGEGHTYNPQQAEDQGLTYTPPSDPPVVPSEDDLQGAEIAAGFASSMVDSAPGSRRMRPGMADNDLNLQENVYQALGANSETAHLTNLKVQVSQGVVSLLGTVPSQDDPARVYTIVSELDGVLEVRNHLSVALEEVPPGEEGGAPEPGREAPEPEGPEIENRVDESSQESFPASDPPAWTSSAI